MVIRQRAGKRLMQLKNKLKEQSSNTKGDDQDFTYGDWKFSKDIEHPKMPIEAGLTSIKERVEAESILTQPRITPVTKNCDFISEQLCCPITDLNTNYNDETETTNTNIQYAYSGYDHISKLQNYFLRLLNPIR